MFGLKAKDFFSLLKKKKGTFQVPLFLSHLQYFGAHVMLNARVWQ